MCGLYVYGDGGLVHQGRYFAYKIFKRFFLNEGLYILPEIPLKVVSEGTTDNSTLIQIGAEK